MDFSRSALAGVPIVDRGVDRPAGDDPQYQRDQDELRQAFGH